MKTPKVPEVKMPYAANTASFFGDQGSAPGGSFLGKLYSPKATPIIRNPAGAKAGATGGMAK